MEKRPSVTTKVAEVGGLMSVSVTSISVAELRYGVDVLPEGKRKRLRLASLYAVLDAGIEVRPFDQDAGAVFGWAGALLKG